MIKSQLRLRQVLPKVLPKVLPDAIVIAVVMIARLTGTLQFLELTVLDTMLRLRPAEPMDERVVIVGITEDDIQRAKTYPLPDRNIAQIIQRLNTYQPAVIGLDLFRDLPVPPGHAELVKIFQTTPNVIAVEKALPDRTGAMVKPPPTLPPDQIGFADALLDSDGKLRRSLLGASNEQGDFRFSLSMRLAETYLKKTANLDLDNGVRDSEAMRFGSVELPRFRPNTGGYVRADAGGVQTLINFRSGRHPFPVLTLPELQTGVEPARLRDKIVLIGVIAPSVKDIVNTSAIAAENPALIYGVEAQAHAVSQIISAVLDRRPLLTVWDDGWEYLWIGVWGVLGIVLGRSLSSPAKSFWALMGVSLGLILGGYGGLILGWWIPMVPALLALMLNGVGLAAFYRYDEALRSRLRDRQMTIDQTFNAIHNGPLQTLAQLLRTAQEQEISQPQLLQQLRHLNQELRQVYDVVRQEALLPNQPLAIGYRHLGQDRELNLQVPLHELLQEVYSIVLERDLPGFRTLKVKVVNFEPLAEHRLDVDHKRALCRFLEEALCNVGKHAIAPTRLDILCTQSQGQNMLRVTDNGQGIVTPLTPVHSDIEGMGTQQAKRLGRRLGGRFQREFHPPHGMACELTWPIRPGRGWPMGKFW